MEDLFYCGDGDFSDAEEKQIKAFVSGRKKVWRIKTRPEFIDTLGPRWASYVRADDGAWNSDGKMEWLLGKPLHEVMNTQADREHWNGMERISGEMEFNESTQFKVLDHEGSNDDDPWIIWPHYDIVYDYPV
jgi:hypothetical protein